MENKEKEVTKIENEAVETEEVKTETTEEVKAEEKVVNSEAETNSEENKDSKEESEEERRKRIVEENEGQKIKKERSYRRKILRDKLFRGCICIFFCILSIFPFYSVIVNSTLDSATIQRGITVIPGSMFVTNWNNLIKKAEASVPIWTAMKNSFLIAAPFTVLAVYFSTMTAYGIHVYNFKMKRFAWAFILGIMMVPTQVSIIGFIKMIMSVGLYDTYLPLILPAVAAPSVVFFMRQYMKTGLPLEIVEAARIDGSNELKTFNMISVPLMKPAMATQAIFTFILTWNNLYNPTMLLSSQDKYTLPMFVQILRGDQFRADYGMIYMGIFITIVPLLVVYAFLSKYIIAGVALGGVKE